MPLWLAILLTLLGSSLTNVSVALLKKAMVQRPVRLLSSGLALTGWTTLVGGYGIFLLATTARAAPISLLQPLSAFGLVVIALLAVFFLHERFRVCEWVGISLLLAGVVLLGLSAEGQPTRSAPAAAWLVVFMIGASGLGLALLTLRSWLPGQRSEEVLFGLSAGLLFGMGYVSTKLLSIGWQEHAWHLLGLAVLGIAVGMIGGLMVLLVGFRRGRALMVSAVNFVTNQVLVGIGGMVCLGESFPREHEPFVWRIAGLSAIVAGMLLFAVPSGLSGRRASVTASRTPLPEK